MRTKCISGRIFHHHNQRTLISQECMMGYDSGSDKVKERVCGEMIREIEGERAREIEGEREREREGERLVFDSKL